MKKLRRILTMILGLIAFTYGCSLITFYEEQSIYLDVKEKTNKTPVLNYTATFLDAQGKTLAITELLTLDINPLTRTRESGWITRIPEHSSNFSSQQYHHPQFVDNDPLDAKSILIAAPGCVSQTIPVALKKEYVEGTGLVCFHGCRAPYWKYSQSETVLLDCTFDEESRKITAELNSFYSGFSQLCPQKLRSGIALAEINMQTIEQFVPTFSQSAFAKNLQWEVDQAIRTCPERISDVEWQNMFRVLRNFLGQDSAALPLYEIIKKQTHNKNLHALAIDILKDWKDEKLPTFLEQELADCQNIPECRYLLVAKVKLLAHPDQSNTNQLKILESFTNHPNEYIRESVQYLKHPPENVSYF